MDLFALHGIDARYGFTPILRDVNLGVRADESVAVLGRNGVGKSTLLKVAAGVLRPTTGRVELDGTDITDLQAHERSKLGIGFMGQDRSVFPSLSAVDNVAAAAGGRSLRAARLRARDLIRRDFPSLEPHLESRSGSLSGGQQRLLALARVMMTHPRVLLLDEPTQGLQPNLVDDLAQKLVALKERHGLSLVIVEQRLDFAAKVADRGLIMVKGSVVKDVEVTTVLSDTHLQREYLGV